MFEAWCHAYLFAASVFKAVSSSKMIRGRYHHAFICLMPGLIRQCEEDQVNLFFNESKPTLYIFSAGRPVHIVIWWTTKTSDLNGWDTLTVDIMPVNQIAKWPTWFCKPAQLTRARHQAKANLGQVWMRPEFGSQKGSTPLHMIFSEHIFSWGLMLSHFALIYPTSLWLVVEPPHIVLCI